MAGILAFSVLPGEISTEHLAVFRWRIGGSLANGLHVIVYAGLAALWHQCFSARSTHYLTGVLWAIGITVVYGMLMEWLQVSITGRKGSLGDVLFNAIGALAGAWLATLFRTRFGAPASS